MHTWLCSNCGLQVQERMQPHSAGCKKTGAWGNHKWTRLTRFIKEVFNF